MNDEPIRCPKCGSTQIHADKKGFNIRRAIYGTSSLHNMERGILIGTLGQNQIIITCLKCGKEFLPGEGKSTPISESKNKGVEYKDNESNIVICSKCGGKSISSHSFCCECGKTFDDNDKRVLESIPLPIMTCPSCHKMTTKLGKYCSKCGKQINIPTSKSGCASVIFLLILVSALVLYL